MFRIYFLLLATGLLTGTMNAQKATVYRKPIEDQLVPQEVRMSFKKQYPKAPISIWYVSHITYWYEDCSSSWYGDWVIPRTTIVYTFEYPSYYEVDFYRKEENSRAIYNRYGQWFETRTKISHLPDIVSDALKQAGYVDWSWSRHKERIEAPGMEGSIYRLQVSTGRQYLVVRISDQGEIMQLRSD